MTVAELIVELQKYPADLEARVNHGGITRPIKAVRDGLYFSPDVPMHAPMLMAEYVGVVT